MAIPSTSWDEATPANTEALSLGDDRIREVKNQVAELFNVSHQLATGSDDQNGHHTSTYLLEQANLGTGAVGYTILGNQTANSKGELIYVDEGNTDIQLTEAGKIKISTFFRSGDLLLSSSVTTPPGFSDVSGTYNNAFIRMSSGTALSTGGTNTHDHGGVTGGHALTIGEMPAHTHTYSYDISPGAGNSGGSTSTVSTGTTGSTGSGNAHTHTIASANNIPAYVQMKMYQRS